MRSKRLLAMLLTFCLVLSCLAPTAFAVEAPADSVANAVKTEEEANATKTETSPFQNDLLVSEDNAYNGSLSMRDDPLLRVDVSENESDNIGEIEWSATPVEGQPSVSLLPEELPACLDELQEAAKLYSADDVVSAFVVMEERPLAEVYTSRSLVTAEVEKQMIQQQNVVINAIEARVLGGQKLEVRYQFTYLTNSFSIKTAFGNLEKIAMLDGVKSVFLTPIYEPATVSDPNTAAAGAMTGVHTVWEDLGYTGAGMKIAIIDTGLDLDHPSFAADPALNENSMTIADIDAVLTELNAYALRPTITGKTLYRSAKVPYAFNYVDESLTADHTQDQQGDHGTHVAGIAAANKLEGTSVVGMAPDAQIIVMKVFGQGGGAYADDIVAALEDAMILGCDVVNGSLGSPAGFATSDTEIDLIYERLAAQNIIATFSAGNEGTSAYGNMWGTDLNRTQNPDNATVGSPSTYANTFSIASAENSAVMTDYFTLADGTKVFFQDSVEAIYANAGYEQYLGAVSLLSLADQTLEYVIIDGLGEAENFYDADGNSLVEGKIAVVKRGELSFANKVANAEAAGAAGVLIWNNNSTDDIFTFGMSTSAEDGSFPGIPSALITIDDGELLAAAETKTMTVSAEQAARACEGGQMSSFSSWGVSPDLQLLPDITGIGGNVYSCYDGGIYGLMSGTSMSAPQIAGVSALIMQYLQEQYPNAAEGAISEMAMALMMSTADPIIDTDSGVEASPRQQGAGLINAAQAISAKAYLTVEGGRPKAELGDSANGVFSVNFEIHNISEEDLTYTLSSSLLTEAVASAYGQYFMLEMDMPLLGEIYFDHGDSVTVPAGETVEVTVTISLSADSKEFIEKYWENGTYVEGFLYLVNEEGAYSLNMPFLGFYGDWTDAPVFDTAFWYDNSFWGAAPATGLPEGDQYYNVIWTSLGGQDWVLGFNPYSGALLDADGNIYYDPALNVLSPNGDGVLDNIDEIYLSLLRNAKTLTFSYTVDGEVMHREVITNAPKTMYRSAYGQIVPWLYSWYGWDAYDFTGMDGKPLPNNTQVLLTIDANIDYGTGGDHSIEIPITIDTQAPELVRVYELPQSGDVDLMFVELTENVAPASVVLMNPAGTRILAQDYFFDETGNGTYIIGFDITGLGTEFLVGLCDYACNEAYYDVTYTADPDGNLPSVDTSVLYGYRVYDDHLMSDHMYGWISTNKPVSGEYADISVLTDDYLEYASITAAEYVDGKVFAVDAVYNFVVLDPGLWNRTTVCNLGMAVLDMAFDDVTDTMYLVAKDEWSYSHLYTIDLLTGELTHVVEFDYYNYGPWAITFDTEGTMYAIKVGSSNLYTVDTVTGEMTVVTDAEGNPFVMTDENGTKLSPSAYSQSITYSEADDTIYWAYFKYSWWGSNSTMVAINMADLSVTTSTYAAQAYDSTNTLVDYYPATEVVGLMVLEDTDYELPEATELLAISLDATRLVMGVGDTTKVKASGNPWNYDLPEVQWSSSDENVATVENGSITAVGAGDAVITASVGDLTAQCTVTVVDISGDFNAYNYYSGDGNYGYMINVNMATMNYSLTGAPGADFVAGDYNGHDDYFYGYTEGGQFWRYNIESGETIALGNAIGTVPSDMAYDYSTGFMYAITMDYNTGATTLNAVNLSNGELFSLGECYNYLMTLACDLEGNIYSIDYAGNLLKLIVEDGYVDFELLMDGLGELSYMQSMCYDHDNDVIIWANPEYSTIYWINIKHEMPYVISLGDPTGSGLQFVGLYTVPESIPALDDVAVESVSAEDIMILTGTTKHPSVTVLPLNATSKAIAWTSADESIAKVNADGSITGVSDGVVTISGELTDTISGETFAVSFDVTVITGADNLYGHILTDLATYGGYYWTRLYPTDPASPDILGTTEYVMYAGEYYNGKLYAFGYDPYIWSGASWNLFILDPITQVVEKQILMDESFPFVYDMTYDYNTSTMYAVAGPSENDADLYIVNMETGELTLFMETTEFFMSLAAGRDGKIYAIENSQEVLLGYDDWGWEIYGYGNAQLYTIDPITKTIEHVGDTGIQSNMIASMTYDYDTDMLYWTPVFRESFYSPMTTGLAMIDPETAEGYNLGMIGAAGAQASGLYTICDTFPTEPEPALLSLVMTPVKTDLVVGQSTELKAVTIPMVLDAEITWSSSDTDVVTVDENGVITAIGQGSAIVTATASYNGVQMSAECRVAILAEDAAFLTYNVTDGGWAEISRMDGTVVTNLTEGEETAVAAFASVDGDIYGYDVENNLFKLDTATFAREIIGQIDSAALIEEQLIEYDYTEEEIADMLPGYAFEVRDMDYDSSNDRLLVLGNIYDIVGGELTSGNGVYEVNLTDGSVTKLFTFHDHYYVMAMTVDTEGTVYFYNTFNDNYASLDLVTGEWKNIISLQSQSYYGDGEADHALYYDAITGKLYHLFTGNGNYYRLFSVDLTTGAINLESNYVGEVVYDRTTWGYLGDLFAGMTFVDRNAHLWVEESVTAPSCTENGEIVYTCTNPDHENCTKTEVLPATGHNYGKVQFSWNFIDYSAVGYQICEDCGHQLNHETTVTSEVFEATCVEAGKTVYTATCVVEGETCTSTFIVTGAPATGEHSYVDGVCTNCGAADPAVPVYEADIIGASMGLNGTLDLRFYAVLSEDLAAAEDVSMQFTVNGKTENVALSDAIVTTVNGQECYVFEVKLAAKQMADEVTAQIMMGDQTVGQARSYSIKQYAEAKIANENSSNDLVALMKSMLNYGAAAQVFFDYNAENLANAGLDVADKVLPTVDASDYAYSIVGAEDGIKAAGASLEIASENTIRIYFKLTGDKTIDEYIFTVDGEPKTPVILNGMYCIEVPGIDAKGLDEMHEISVGGLTVNYSGLSYVNQVLKSSSSTQEKIDLVTALYLYNQAANDFFEAE